MHEAMHERERLTPELKVGDFDVCSSSRALHVIDCSQRL